MHTTSSVVVALLAITPALAKKVGHYDSEICVDPSGFESCYKDAEATWADCVNENCKDQNIDCINVCTCIQNLDELDCAGQSCWNQVYSCEYQNTVNDLTVNCLNPKLDSIPFWPPPDDAKAGCSCNMGKIVTSQYRSNDDLNKCADVVQENNRDGNDIRPLAAACLCCSGSSQLSAIWDICPSTKPSLLGADEGYALITMQNEDWDQCGDVIAANPYDKSLGWSSPAQNVTNYYTDGNFPANGTEELFNTGTVTSPVSGATYTYTYFSNIERVVTVQSADAHPTSTSNGGGNDNSDTEEQTGDGGNGGSQNDDDESSAMTLLARWSPLGAVLLALVFAL
ncbi:hypothetical protein ACHAQH_008318 [Verticillium albo-atrum]